MLKSSMMGSVNSANGSRSPRVFYQLKEPVTESLLTSDCLPVQMISSFQAAFDGLIKTQIWVEVTGERGRRTGGDDKLLSGAAPFVCFKKPYLSSVNYTGLNSPS